MNSSGTPEAIIEPDLPIIDAHHHLWYRTPASGAALDTGEWAEDEVSLLRRNFSRYPRYLFDELMADATSGHNICGTVYVEVHSMYRTSGPEDLRSVGEVEFANGAAAMAESGIFGAPKLCAGIVGGADLRKGSRIKALLDAHIHAGGGRYRGIRASATAFDRRLRSMNTLMGSSEHLLADSSFREGFAELGPLGLSCDIFVYETQIPDVGGLAAAFPDTQIILNHVGMPIGMGIFAGGHAERFSEWQQNIRNAARSPNVAMKIGGLGNAMCGLPILGPADRVGSVELADLWRPYIETCIEAFGPERCMFESNYPVDGVTADYPIIWNAFKRIVSGASAEEKLSLFHGAANRIYRLAL